MIASQGLPQHFLGNGGMQSLGIAEMLCFTAFSHGFKLIIPGCSHWDLPPAGAVKKIHVC